MERNTDMTETKGLSGINRFGNSTGRGLNSVIPFAVEILARDVEALHLGVRNDYAFGINLFVGFAANRQAGACRGRADEFDDYAIADQRLGAPVLSDERE